MDRDLGEGVRGASAGLWAAGDGLRATGYGPRERPATRPRRGNVTRGSRRALLSIAAAVLLACTARPPPPGLGERRAAAPARQLRATADGAWLAFLDGCADVRVQGLPPGTASCDLRVVAVAGGEAAKVAGAVSTLPGAMAVSPRGAELAVLADYDYALTSGTLVRWRAGAAAQALASGVTFHGYGPDGALGYVAGGEAWIAPPAGEPVKVVGVAGAATLELAAPGGALAALVRRRAAAGGELLVVPASVGGVAPAAVTVAGPVGDYGFGRGRQYAFTRLTRDGAQLEICEARPAAKPEALGRGVGAFAFSPQGDAIAYVGDAVPGKVGNLHLRAAGRDALLAKAVGAFRWAAQAPRLAWLEEYYAPVSAGTLAVGGPGLARRTFGKNVSDLELSPDGKHVAFLQHSTRGGYSVDLMLAAVDGAPTDAARRLGSATYGFGFSPDGRWFYYRTRCTRSGEACDLERIDPAAGAGAKPELIAEGVKSFEFAPADAGRLLVSWKRVDRDLLDLAVWEAGALVKVDSHVLPGSAAFVGVDSRRVAYVVVDGKRGGVYVATLAAR